MKPSQKFAAATLIALPLLLAGCQGEMSAPTGSDTSSPVETQKPDAVYEMSRKGVNLRVIEFTPKGNPNYTCVSALARSLDSHQMSCFPKAKM